MTVALVVVSFLLGAAAAAFVAALYVRRSSVTLATEPVSPLPGRTARLAPRVVAALDVGVVVVDRDEIAVLANPVARQMGVLDADRLAIPALRELVRTVTDSAAAGTELLDLAPSRRGPESRSFLVRAMPLREDGRVDAVVLRFSDVTETRRLDRVRRDFVANVSHELKTPVGALTLLAEAVQEAADDPEAVQRFAERMQREGSRLGRLVQELIELSRLQGAEPLPATDAGQRRPTCRRGRGPQPAGRRAGRYLGGRAHRSRPEGVRQRDPAGHGGGQPGRQRRSPTARRAPVSA